MALSLVCKDCDTQLRNVKEAQEHNEVTGHTNFEESKEPLLNIMCVECGKPCRSQTERELHTKRTGHAQFADKTNEAAALDTESQMKAAAAELKAEAREAASELRGEVMDVDGGGGGTAGAQPGAEAGGPAEEQVEPEVDGKLLEELQGMGFSRNKCVRALHATGNGGVESAVNWVVEHEGDEDLDAPLLVPKSKSKKLSPEEARAKAEALIKAAREKREREEKELERIREKERIRAGKELALAQRQEEELRLKRMLDARRMEKEEEARAREKIRLKLEEDRRARRRALGLPEELTEEEQEAERKKAADKAAAEAKRKLPVKPISAAEKLRAQLVDIKKRQVEAGTEPRAAVCFTTLMKLVGNVAKAPGEEKFRRLRLSNAAIQERVGSVPGAVEFLAALGFQRDGDESLVLPEDKVDVQLLQVAGGELNNALTNPFFGKL